MLNFLVCAVEAEASNGVCEEPPTGFCLGQVIGSRLRIGLVETWRGGDLSERGDGRGRGTCLFRPEGLWVAARWEDIEFVFCVATLDRIIEACLAVLYFAESVRLTPGPP